MPWARLDGPPGLSPSTAAHLPCVWCMCMWAQCAHRPWAPCAYRPWVPLPLLLQAQHMSAQVDRDRGEASELLLELQRDLGRAVELLRATTTTAPAAVLGPPGVEAAQPPPSPGGAGAAAGAAAASPSRAGGAGGGGGGLSYSLAGSVALAARAVPELRAGLERLRGELWQLAAERDAARAGWEAATGHACLLARAVAEALPLPEALVAALLVSDHSAG